MEGGGLEGLMERVAAGDESAFADLVPKLRPRILRFLRHLGARHSLAEDLCQETLVRLWIARSRYQPRAMLTTFVLKIAYRCYLNARDKAAVRYEVSDERLPEVSANPEEWILGAYRRRCIEAAIAALPDGPREVFQMAHLDQMPYAEIADLLDIPLGTVKSRMSTALRLLRIRLQHSL